jgi:hypothetical protein
MRSTFYLREYDNSIAFGISGALEVLQRKELCSVCDINGDTEKISVPQ